MNRSLRFFVGLALFGSLLISLHPHARAQEGELTRLFPNEADIMAIEGDAPSDGSFVRLPLSPEVLGQVREDFSDIRIYTSYGSTVPFTIDRGTGPLPRVTEPAFVTVLATDPTESTSRVGGITRARETFHIVVPHASNASGTWTLRVGAMAGANFVRQYVVRLSDAYGGREIARGAIYQFREGGRTSIRLPGLLNADFVLELEGEGAPLRPSFTLAEEARIPAAPLTTLVPLTIASTRTEGTQTTYTVNCPEGFPVEAFEFESSTTAFVRAVTVQVNDARGGARQEGAGLLVRVPAETIPEGLVIPTAATGRAVEIRVENRDSPPLEGVVIRARIRTPSLLLEYHPGEVMRWGGGRARRPDFDLMSYAVEAFEREGRSVRLGATRPNPTFDNTPLLATSMRPGAVIDTTRFTHEASLTVPESVDGIVRFDVPPEMWAAARSDLSDLRIVDAAGAQWPYLTGNDPQTASVPFTVQAPAAHATAPNVSVHHLVLPLENVIGRRLHFTLPLQPISRSVTAFGTQLDGTEVSLGATSWVGNGTDASSFEVWLDGVRVRSLRLEIENGDEAPLALTEGTLEADGHRLYVVAAPGAYRVLVGSSENEPPNYDLANFSETILMLRVEPATLGILSPNTAYHEPTWIEASGWQTVAASAALGLVVLLLFALTLRIVRSDPAPEATSTSPTESPASPTESPASPTESPASPTESSASPTESSASPTESPASPTESPASPTEASASTAGQTEPPEQGA